LFMWADLSPSDLFLPVTHKQITGSTL
jgi:hypothetical protein